MPWDKGYPSHAAQIPIQIRILAAPLVGIFRVSASTCGIGTHGRICSPERASDLSHNEAQGQLTQSSPNPIIPPNCTSTGNVSLSEAPAERCILKETAYSYASLLWMFSFPLIIPFYSLVFLSLWEESASALESYWWWCPAFKLDFSLQHFQSKRYCNTQI